MVYQWKYSGLTTDTKIVIVADSDELDTIIQQELTNTQRLSNIINPSRDLWTNLNTLHQKKWETEKEDFINKTCKIINFKKHSLETSFRAEKLSIESILIETTDEKIRLMKKSQLEHCIDNYNRKVNELEDKLNKVDIHFKTLIYGVLKIGE